jgi:hypothetical protein
MSIKCTKISQILIITAAASLCSVKATLAETTTQPVSLNEAFNQAYFKHGKNAIKQSNIFGQIDAIVGFTGFPEQHISRDTKSVDELYQNAMNQQSAAGMPMMTQDLMNPYRTSLSENMEYVGY